MLNEVNYRQFLYDATYTHKCGLNNNRFKFSLF